MTDRTPPFAQPAPDKPAPVFDPAKVRPRHDGWTPERQVAFIEALAATACVDEAARHVGMSRESAYTLRRRPGADSFRQAWELALNHAVARLADAALGRAMNGVATPIFYKGEQIGERRRYDERLTMFLLRYRDPCRYGAWRDRAEHRVGGDTGRRLARALEGVAVDARLFAEGKQPPVREPYWFDEEEDDFVPVPLPPLRGRGRGDSDDDMV